MKKILIIVTFISLFVFIGTSCGENKDNVQDNTINDEVAKKGNDETAQTRNMGKKLALDFTLNDLDGNEIKISSLRGKKVWLNIWASWCGPCINEMPHLNKINNEVDKNDLVILTINSGETKAKAEKFINDNNYSFTVLLDESQKVSKMYSVTGIPTSIFINKDGYITDRISGSLTYEQMMKYIENIK